MSAVEYVYSSWCLNTKDDSLNSTKLTTAKNEMYCIQEYLSTSDTEGVYLMLCSGIRRVRVALNCLTREPRGTPVLLSASMKVGWKLVDTECGKK